MSVLGTPGGVAGAGNEIEVIDDTRKGTTYGDPDGPPRFVETLGCMVPTYIDPRMDLIPVDGPRAGRDKAFKRLDYHVPMQMRGVFTLGQWPKEIQMKYGNMVRTDMQGYVMCTGVNKGSRSGQRTSVAGSICKKRAQHRTLFCAIHGAGLHPSDKKMSSLSLPPIPQDRVKKLDRVQLFMQGFLLPEDLDDDEIQHGYVRNSAGDPIRGYKLGAKFQSILAKELHTRLNQFLQSNTSEMLKVMVDIAKNDLYEAADRIKAAAWVAEKTMGKAPDVLISTGTTNAPFASILDSIEAGSREDYRRSVESSRGGVGEFYRESEILDAEVEGEEFGADFESFGEGDDEWEEDSELSESDGEPDSEENPLAYVEGLRESREEKLARGKAIKKAKQRRYAARAVGATSLTATPWLVEFVPYELDDRGRGRVCAEEVAVGYKMKLYPPDRQTLALLERLSKKVEGDSDG